MKTSRRRFLRHTSLGVLAAVAPCLEGGASPPDTSSGASNTTGTPPAFATSPAAGPEVSASTIAEAEKLVRVELTEAQRAQAAASWQVAMAPLYQRRTGPH